MDRLTIFDLDGTLVEDHLTDTPCDICGGSGEVYSPPNRLMHPPRPAEHLKCLKCRGTGKLLVPRTDRAYTDPIIVVGVEERLRELAELDGMTFAIATNQGGVALGFQTTTEVDLRIARSLSEVSFFFGRPFSVHYSYDHPEGRGSWADPSPARLRRRKPEPGMLFEAYDQSPALRRNVRFVGDRESDKTAAIRGQFGFADAADWLNRGNAALGF